MPVPPKPASKRRRRNVPKSYGAATPITAAAAGHQDRVLGIDGPVHDLVERMWEVAQTSAESVFFSEADWARLRLELWYANGVLTCGKPISANAWSTIQHGLSDMLMSPHAKRQIGIELKPPTSSDPDEVAAVSMLSVYRDKLKPT